MSNIVTVGDGGLIIMDSGSGSIVNDIQIDSVMSSTNWGGLINGKVKNVLVAWVSSASSLVVWVDGAASTVTLNDTIVGANLFNNDDHLFIVGRDEIRIVELATMSEVFNNYTSTTNVYKRGAISEDGSLIALINETAPHMQIHEFNTTTWTFGSLRPTPASTSTDFAIRYNTEDVIFSADGSRVLRASNGSITNGFEVFNTSTGVLEIDGTSSLLVMPSTIDAALDLAPDGTRVCFASTTVGSVVVFDLLSGMMSVVPVVNNAGNATYAKAACWLDDDTIIIATSDLPSLIKHVISESSNTPLRYGSEIVLVAATKADNTHKVSGTITENLENQDWICSAHDITSGVLLNQTSRTGPGDFEITLTSDAPVSVTVMARAGDRWAATKSYAIGARIYPTNPDTSPYYHECVTGGLSGSTEPVWSTTAGGNTVDGSVTWQLIERLIQPITNSPLVPIPVA